MTDTLLALIRNPETPTWLLREAVMDAQVHSVWVVQDLYGEYSDSYESSLAAFLCKKQAKEWMGKIEAEYEVKTEQFRQLEEENPAAAWALIDSKEGVLEICPQVCYSDFYSHFFRIIEIPLRAEG